MECADELRERIRDAEALLMRHAPDPYDGWCGTCAASGPCEAYVVAAELLGVLRAERDHAEADPEA